MTIASRSLATAQWRARFTSGLLPPSYTTTGDTTLVRLLTYGRQTKYPHACRRLNVR
jgi:hypothetical protein